jgi:site-specific recombinase XerD
MSDQNVLKRHIQPVARRLGLNFVDWRCLRRSYATWLVQSGADPKSVQGQMRHSRVQTSRGCGESAASGREAIGGRES